MRILITLLICLIPIAAVAQSVNIDAGGGGASTIDELTDVDNTDVATDDLLKWNGTEYVPLNIDEIVVGSGANAFVLGIGSVAGGNNTTIFGANITGNNNNSTGMGSNVGLNSSNSSAFGSVSKANGLRSSAFGNQADALGADSSAFGWDAEATVTGATALGAKTSATHTNSTAIGISSETTAANQIMMGRASETVHVPGDLEVMGNSRTPSQFTEKTGNYTLTAADLGGTILYNSTGAGTLTIPSGLSINNGDFVGFVQGNTGTLSLSSSGSMALNTFTGFTTKGQYASGAVHFRSSTEGLVKGELE